MKKILIFACAVFGIAGTSTAMANSEVKDIRGKRRVVHNCSGAISGLTGRKYRRLTFSKNGRELCLRASASRECYDTGAAYRYSKCEDSVLKVALTSAPEQFTTLNLTASDFPEITSNLARECKTIASWPSSMIYKVVGSVHISPSDCRRSSIALVQTSSLYGTHSCVDVLDTKGNKIGAVGRYFPNGHWAGRYYGCTGCSKETLTGSMVSSRARASTGNSNIYLKMGNTCVGPIDGGRCKNSSAC